LRNPIKEIKGKENNMLQISSNSKSEPIKDSENARAIENMATLLEVDTDPNIAVLFILRREGDILAWGKPCRHKDLLGLPKVHVIYVPSNEVPIEALKESDRGKLVHMSVCVWNDLEHTNFRHVFGLNTPLGKVVEPDVEEKDDEE